MIARPSSIGVDAWSSASRRAAPTALPAQEQRRAAKTASAGRAGTRQAGEQGGRGRKAERGLGLRQREPAASEPTATCHGRRRGAGAERLGLPPGAAHSCSASRSVASRFSPMPSTCASSASERKPPCASRYSMMRWASVGPMPSTPSSCSTVAVDRWMPVTARPRVAGRPRAAPARRAARRRAAGRRPRAAPRSAARPRAARPGSPLRGRPAAPARRRAGARPRRASPRTSSSDPGRRTAPPRARRCARSRHCPRAPASRARAGAGSCPRAAGARTTASTAASAHTTTVERERLRHGPNYEPRHTCG